MPEIRCPVVQTPRANTFQPKTWDAQKSSNSSTVPKEPVTVKLEAMDCTTVYNPDHPMP